MVLIQLGALLKSDHVITGELHCPSQYHFHMETHVCMYVYNYV